MVFLYDELRQILDDNGYEDIAISTDCDGISFDNPDGDTVNMIPFFNEYFDIEISSIHIDDADSVGIWITLCDE